MKPERVFADTNLFLRYLTNDVPAQADEVERLLHQAAAQKLTLVINSLVIAEIVWTLESFYKLPRTAIRDKVLAIFNTPGIQIVDSDLVLQGITEYVDKNVDFIDAYNGAWLLKHGMTMACTFDRAHFARLPGITVITPSEIS